MIRLRIVYAEELVALARLFFLTEGRLLNSEDYQIVNESNSLSYFILKTNISLELQTLLERFEIETIWAPIWVSGLARGFFSDQALTAAKLANLNIDSLDIDIRWADMYQQIVWIDRNEYSQVLSLIDTISDNAWIFVEGVDYKRLVTGGLSTQESVDNFFRPPQLTNNPQVNKAMIESYILGANFFVIPYDLIPNISEESLKETIRQNYRQTRSRRVPGGRQVKRFADLGYAVYLDSFDEFKTLLPTLLNSSTQNLMLSNHGRLEFPTNPMFTGDDLRIWQSPVTVGNENLHLELSYTRDSGEIDPTYQIYRETRIANLNPAKKEFFLSKLNRIN